MIGRTIIGRVKLSNDKGWGFITGDDGRDYYFSSSNVDIPSKYLPAGYTVSFIASTNDRGLCAKNIKLYQG